jgi:DNA-binding response OmpR family regulator
MRVLVVDDNRDCADTIAVLLKHLGHECRASYSADSGLTDAVDFQPQLIILDLAMPAKDGYALIREVRSCAGLGNVPVAAMTGYADGRHRDVATAAGFNAYLVKPCGLDQLQDLLLAVGSPVTE